MHLHMHRARLKGKALLSLSLSLSCVGTQIMGLHVIRTLVQISISYLFPLSALSLLTLLPPIRCYARPSGFFSLCLLLSFTLDATPVPLSRFPSQRCQISILSRAQQYTVSFLLPRPSRPVKKSRISSCDY